MELSKKVTIDPKDADTPWALNDGIMDTHLAGGDPDITIGKCELYFGDMPEVYDFHAESIRALKRNSDVGDAWVSSEYEGGVDEVLKQARSVRPSWRYYVICYGVGIGNACPRLKEFRVGINYGGNESKPVKIVDVWPKAIRETQFEAGMEVVCQIDAHGQIVTSALPPELFTNEIGLPYGGRLSFGGRGDIVARFGVKIEYPVIEAFGIHSSFGAWTFRRKGNNSPQQLMCHIVRTLASVSEIDVEVVMSGIYRGFFQASAEANSTFSIPIQLQ